MEGRLRDELGFDVDYESTMGTFSQDPFGYYGSMLDAFYSKLTPSYVINRLVQMINESQTVDDNHRMLNEAGAYLTRVYEEAVPNGFEFENSEAEEDLDPKSIKNEGVEHILVLMNILKRDTPGQ